MQKKFMDYERPSVTADVVLFSIGNEFVNIRKATDKKLRVLLIKRTEDPCKNKYSLPGGFVSIDETIEDVARRKVQEKTGFSNFYLEQLYTFDGIDRDDRWRVITTAYIGVLRPSQVITQGGSHEAEWFIIDDNGLVNSTTGEKLSYDELAFDHGKIINTALERVRGKLFYSDIGFEFEEKTFTVGSLQKTFETIMRKPISNFKRTMASRIKETGEIVSGNAFRPAQLFVKKDE